MPEYCIKWEIDGIYAASPLEAVRIAREIQLDPQAVSTVFLVQPQGTDDNDWTEIDLLDEATAQKATEIPQPARYGCPRGHTEGIKASYTIDIEMPADLADPDETTNANLNKCETDNWEFRHYWCPQCNETFDALRELTTAEAPKEL